MGWFNHSFSAIKKHLSRLRQEKKGNVRLNDTSTGNNRAKNRKGPQIWLVAWTFMGSVMFYFSPHVELVRLFIIWRSRTLSISKCKVRGRSWLQDFKKEMFKIQTPLNINGLKNSRTPEHLFLLEMSLLFTVLVVLLLGVFPHPLE